MGFSNPIRSMKTPITKAILLGLAVAITPVVRAAEAPPIAEVKIDQASVALDASFDSLRETLSIANNQVTEAISQRDLALKELAARRQAQAEAERELASIKKQLKATQKGEAQWKAQSEKLAKKLAAGEEAHAKLAQFRDQMTGALQEFSSLQKDIASVRGELQAPAERLALRTENAKLKQAKIQLAAKLDDTNCRLAAESKRLQKTDQQLTTVTRKNVALNNMLAAAEEKGTALGAEIEVAGREMQTLDAANRELHSKMAGQEKVQATFQHQLSKKQAELDTTAAARKSAENKLAAASQVIEESKDSIVKLTKQGEQLRKTNRQAHQELKNIRKKADAEQSARRQIEKLQANTVKQANELRAELATSTKQADGLRGELTESSKQAKKLSEELAANTKQADSLRGELDRSKQQVATEKGVSNETAKKVEALNAQLEGSRKELAASQKLTKTSATALATIRKDTEELRSIVGLTNQKLKNTKQQAEKAQAAAAKKIADLSAKLKSTSEAQAAAEISLKERDARIAKLQASLDKKQGRETAQNKSNVE